MATVHCDTDCRNGVDDNDEGGRHPFDPSGAGEPVVVGTKPLGIAGRAKPPHGPISRRRARQQRFHRLAEVRNQQGVTLRNVARRLGLDMAEVRRQENERTDLRVSELLDWQEVLEVPIAELLVESEGQLSGPVLERSRMVKLMKTAAAIREQSAGTSAERLADMLIGQILEIMPELRDVTPWHNVGQRRTLDDVGRAARHPVADDFFSRRRP